MGTGAIDERLVSLQQRGVVVVDPRQTYVAADVDLERLCEGAVLHPGARLQGPRTFLGPGAEVGTEGPATLVDTALGERASVASGFLHGAVLLRDARAGANSHFREGTLLEEEASTAHAVGLKQTILMSFVTVGSLVNFCDALVAGGTSRADHSEIGSGYIHFNFTPWGERGDKATPSVIGDVVRGVFLREPRIFLGGSGGMIGPRSVGFGSVTAAGQIVRKDIPGGRIVHQGVREFDHVLEPRRLDAVEPRRTQNLTYVGQLLALAAWYREVRLKRIPATHGFDHIRVVTQAALRSVESCIEERGRRLRAFLDERGEAPVSRGAHSGHPPGIPVADPYTDHVEWVRSVNYELVARCQDWLRRIATAGTE